jgi:hypothetical protein
MNPPKQHAWRVVLCAALSIWAVHLSAQPEDDVFHYGFKGGVNYASIQDIKTTIIPPEFAVQTYTAEEEKRIGYTVGFFIYHRFNRSKFAVQPQISYTARGGNFKYSDVNDLEYLIEFNYQFIDVSTLLKIYPVGGLHFAVGPEIGFNVASTNIDYTSNMPELGPDLQITQSLREVLKGKNDIGILLGVGYDFEFGLMIELQYRMGLTDVIETQANGFNFIENPNKTSTIQFTVGYAIPFFN